MKICNSLEAIRCKTWQITFARKIIKTTDVKSLHPKHLLKILNAKVHQSILLLEKKGKKRWHEEVLVLRAEVKTEKVFVSSLCIEHRNMGKKRRKRECERERE